MPFSGSAAAELWEYDVVDGSEQDFIDAMRNSETVMEFTVVDETSVEAGRGHRDQAGRQ